ncbi:MAG: hypothetical protein LM581_07810, partial [Desulfurococcales archaeon]|nr:hypothetical protein [Desulfurococcales archaeon]
NQVYRDLVETGWFSSPYKFSNSPVHVDLEIIKDEQNTLPQFVLNVDVIKMLIALGLLASKPVFGVITLVLVATVGVEPYTTTSIRQFGYVDIYLKDTWDWAYYQYARSPVKYKYGTSQYTITMLFVDAWIDATGNPHERSYS